MAQIFLSFVVYTKKGFRAANMVVKEPNRGLPQNREDIEHYESEVAARIPDSEKAVLLNFQEMTPRESGE